MSTYFKNDKANDNEDSNNILNKSLIYLNVLNDRVQFFKKERWIVVGILVLIYLIRIILTGGYYAVSYCLGIHLLNAFIGFISPLEDPDEAGDGDSFLPQKNSEEFRPFQRKLKEFSFWQIMFWSFFIGCFLTFNEAFNVPVYWPLLLLYFILIFVLTLRKQINHMIKYKYLPWDAGKVRYSSGSVMPNK